MNELAVVENSFDGIEIQLPDPAKDGEWSWSCCGTVIAEKETHCPNCYHIVAGSSDPHNCSWRKHLRVVHDGYAMGGEKIFIGSFVKGEYRFDRDKLCTSHNCDHSYTMNREEKEERIALHDKNHKRYRVYDFTYKKWSLQHLHDSIQRINDSRYGNTSIEISDYNDHTVPLYDEDFQQILAHPERDKYFTRMLINLVNENKQLRNAVGTIAAKMNAAGNCLSF